MVTASSTPGPSNQLSRKDGDASALTMALHVDGADRTILTGGAPLCGRVVVDLPRARNEGISPIRIKLRGTAKAIVGANAVYSRTPTRVEETVFFRADAPLWPARHATPPNEAGAIELPFEFDLPAGLPPSYCSMAEGKTGSIRYYIEVVGERRGLLRMKRRIQLPLVLMPSVPPLLAGIKEELLAGWDGGWKILKVDKCVRLNTSGLCSDVRAEIFLPNLASYPMSTPIPFRLEVRGVGIASILPAPSSIVLRADRVLIVKADIAMDTVIDHHAPACKLSEGTQWTTIPSSEEGAWALNSHLVIEGPPSFKLSNISIEHRLRLRIPFSGVGNDLIGVFVIGVDSGITADGVPPPWEPPSPEWCNSTPTAEAGLSVQHTATSSERPPDYA